MRRLQEKNASAPPQSANNGVARSLALRSTPCSPGPFGAVRYAIALRRLVASRRSERPASRFAGSGACCGVDTIASVSTGSTGGGSTGQPTVCCYFFAAAVLRFATALAASASETAALVAVKVDPRRQCARRYSVSEV
jgi:hypothetical protein